MKTLTLNSIVYLDGGSTRYTYELYKASSAERHATADDVTLKQALIAGLNAPIGKNKIDQGNGVFRYRINNGLGYLVYKTPGVTGVARSATVFHYHWNYKLDDPLDA